MQSKSKTKNTIRQELLQQIEQFVGNGGDIAVIDRGISGYHDNSPPKYFTYIPNENKTRTDLSFLLNTIDSRKQKKPLKPAKPKRKLLYDDFGEPLRWVWETDQ